MDRIDQLRNARNSPHVSFMEYIKMRSKSANVFLIFEGRQCPSLYVKWITQQLQGVQIGGQIIARGKKNVLLLRELIHRNATTCLNQDMYFVDRDYDVEPKLGTFKDVYVTRGYSIENEVSNWVVLEPYIRAYFDIADNDDQEALVNAKDRFHQLFTAYLAQSHECQRAIFICRTKSIHCIPGESVFDYLSVDWNNTTVRQTYTSIEKLLSALKIGEADQNEVLRDLTTSDIDFDSLDPVLDWRGKFHFSFIKKFLTFLRDARTTGAQPFCRASKVDSDPAHPGVIGALGGFSPAPECLVSFLKSCFDHSSLGHPAT